MKFSEPDFGKLVFFSDDSFQYSATQLTNKRKQKVFKINIAKAISQRSRVLLDSIKCQRFFEVHKVD